MPDILCNCARCFNKDDHLRLLPLRIANGHVWQHGWPTEQQLREHGRELASREASEERKKARLAAREEASDSTQEEERDRRREPEAMGRYSNEFGRAALGDPGGTAGVQDGEGAGGETSKGVLGEGGVTRGSGARDQVATGGPQYISRVHTVKIHTMDATNVAGDYHDNRNVHITNVFGTPDKPADRVSTGAHCLSRRPFATFTDSC